MSTKTTFKRVALVAVAALGLGVLSSVAPASATGLSTEYVTSISASAATAPVAGNAGATVLTTVRFKSSTTSTSVKAHPAVLLISSPSTSNMAAAAVSATALTKGQYSFIEQNALAANASAPSSTAAGIALGSTDSGGTAYNLAADGTANSFLAVYLHTWYDVAGTYKWVFFDDLDESGTINGSEFSSVHTVVVADGGASIAATSSATNATSGAGSTYGSLVKISLGAGANVDSAGGVKVSVSGDALVSYVNGGSVTAASTYTLGRTAFNGSGNAWINVTNATAEVVAVTLSGVGSTTVTGGSINLTFVTTAGTTTGQVSAGSATPNIGTIATNAATAKLGGPIYLKTAGATTAKDDVNITDTFGTITGKSGTSYSIAVAGAATGDYPGAFSIATGNVVAGQYVDVQLNAGTAVRFTAAAQSSTGGAVKTLVAGATAYSAAATLTTAKLSSVTVTVKAYDAFSAGYANKTITPTLSTSSRNYGQVLGTIVTGSAGTVSFTITDANTSGSTTATTDVISFSDGTNTGTLTITYAADATMGISTRLITSNDTDALGVKKPVVTPVAIVTGDGTESGSSTVSLTLKNAAGTLLSGLPVTWSVSGSGAAMKLPTGNTTFSAAGIATADVYAWIAGTYTVTATSGGVAVTVPVTFASTTKESARVISATVSGSIVTAKVVDRFGNPVSSVVLTAKTTSGYFGSGSTTASCTGTSDAGTCDFVLLGGSGDVTVSASKTDYAQTIALKDSQDTDAADVYTATVAATATAAASSVGTSFAPAGVNSVTVSVTGADTTASAATDAAAEATDAANAATDAANAAAEAADAATAAAQDAADAVAALSAQVATLISGLKAQLTALTNLVIKIQKKVKA